MPPDVNEPAGHTWQCAALFELHSLSDPHSTQPPVADKYVPARQNSHCVAPVLEVVPSAHFVQLDAPVSDENVPAAHSSMMLVPLHDEPAGHSEQLVRVVNVPPDVNEPTGQTWQCAALFELHSLSTPHSTQPPVGDK